jgi:hypothetical protein
VAAHHDEVHPPRADVVDDLVGGAPLPDGCGRVQSGLASGVDDLLDRRLALLAELCLRVRPQVGLERQERPCVDDVQRVDRRVVVARDLDPLLGDRGTPAAPVGRDQHLLEHVVSHLSALRE